MGGAESPPPKGRPEPPSAPPPRPAAGPAPPCPRRRRFGDGARICLATVRGVSPPPEVRGPNRRAEEKKEEKKRKKKLQSVTMLIAIIVSISMVYNIFQ